MERVINNRSFIDITNDAERDDSTAPPHIVRYMDDRKRLTDSAIDRFCIASCTQAMTQCVKANQQRGYPMPKPLAWVRSLSITRVLQEWDEKYKSGRIDKTKYLKKLGLGETVSILDYDILILSLYEDEHWSLMVCYVQTESTKYLYHYDSQFGMHANLARRARLLLIELGILPRECKLRRVQDYWQQKADYECGYAVLMMMAAIYVGYVNANTASVIPGTPRVPFENYPSLDKRGVNTIYHSIYRSLGNQTLSSYPTEHMSMTSTRKPESLVTLYRYVCERLLECHNKNKRKRSEESTTVVSTGPTILSSSAPPAPLRFIKQKIKRQ